MLVPLLSYGQTDSIAIIAQSKINSKSENPVNSILFYLSKTNENKKALWYLFIIALQIYLGFNYFNEFNTTARRLYKSFW